jgi:hypothetical protein
VHEGSGLVEAVPLKGHQQHPMHRPDVLAHENRHSVNTPQQGMRLIELALACKLTHHRRIQ